MSALRGSMADALAPVILALVGLCACQDYTIARLPPPPVAEPPPELVDLWGSPPTDWDDCHRGLRGHYYNLEADHPDVEVVLTGDADDDGPPNLDELDWWDEDGFVFSRFDASLEHGDGWWPVDEDAPDDPAYFAVRWVGWLRVTRRTDVPVVLGATSDAWVLAKDELLADVRDADALDVHTHTPRLQPGVYPLDVRYAHRLGDAAGLRMRIASEHAVVCAPEYQ